MMIKLFLIGSVVAIALYLIRGDTSGRHLAIRRLGTLCFASLWAVAVVSPDIVTQIANLMGVGRGTDLVLYVLVVAFVFHAVSQHRHAHELEERITRLTRQLALSQGPARDDALVPQPAPIENEA